MFPIEDLLKELAEAQDYLESTLPDVEVNYTVIKRINTALMHYFERKASKEVRNG